MGIDQFNEYGVSYVFRQLDENWERNLVGVSSLICERKMYEEKSVGMIEPSHNACIYLYSKLAIKTAFVMVASYLTQCPHYMVCRGCRSVGRQHFGT